jgi:hypothetical protein
MPLGARHTFQEYCHGDSVHRHGEKLATALAQLSSTPPKTVPGDGSRPLSNTALVVANSARG